MTRGSTSKNLPVGTQVVTLTTGKGWRGEEMCPAGTVGVVVGSDERSADKYHVRLTDGSVVSFAREGLAVRKHYQRDAAQHGRKEKSQPNFNDYIIYGCVVGSRAFGLDEEGSDYDRRGIFLPPSELERGSD
jgi:uncharacterized protein